jgi:hypothetical protein
MGDHVVEQEVTRPAEGRHHLGVRGEQHAGRRQPDRLAALPQHRPAAGVEHAFPARQP